MTVICQSLGATVSEDHARSSCHYSCVFDRTRLAFRAAIFSTFPTVKRADIAELGHGKKGHSKRIVWLKWGTKKPQLTIHPAEIGVVKEIKKISATLQLQMLGDAEMTPDVEIPLCE